MSQRSAVADPWTVDGTFDWDAVKRALDADVPSTILYNEYGMLADLGLRRDRPFTPDDDTRSVLTEAAVKANEQLVVAAFADDRPERLVWPDRPFFARCVLVPINLRAYARRVIDEDGAQPRCERCGVVMRDIHGGWVCQACGYMYTPTMPIRTPPKFTGPSIHGG